MARKQRNTRPKNTRRRRGGSGLALTLGGNNSTLRPSLTIKQTQNFDLSNDDQYVGWMSGVVPLRLAIYAIPPRDTDIQTSPTFNLATITATIMGAINDSNNVTLTRNRTVLLFNKGPKKIISVDFKKIYNAGVSFPMVAATGGTFVRPIQLTLSTDQGSAWDGIPISIYTVLEYALSLDIGGTISTALIGGSSIQPATAPLIDNDFRPSKLFGNNSVMGYRIRSQVPDSQRLFSLIPNAGAAEAHPDHA